MKHVYLIRHGEVEYPTDMQGRRLVYSPHTPLSQLGKKQLFELAQQLKKEQHRFEVLYVSPFLRAIQSAEILKRELGITNFVQVDDLKDVNPNSYEGYPIDEYAKIGGDIYANPRSSNQETLLHLTKRAKAAIDFIITDDIYENIGVVSHGDLLSAFDWMLKTSDLLPNSYDEMKKRFYLQKGQACGYTLDDRLHIVGEGKFISVSEVSKSREIYR